MSNSSGVGWGAAPWGGGPWGGGTSAALRIVGAVAVRENLIQLAFSRAPYFSGLLDAADASNAALYTLAPVAGSVGADGDPARAASVVLVQVTSPVAPGVNAGTVLDLVLDRALSPFPASYQLAVGALYTQDLTIQLDASTATPTLYGVSRELQPAIPDTLAPARDFANPNALPDAQGETRGAVATTVLGSFLSDETGDYAFDSGTVSLKKRIFRRAISRPGAFLHLGPDYGLGIKTYGKRLGSAAVIQSLAAEAEKQFAREPEVAKCVVTPTVGNGTGRVRFRIAIQTHDGRRFAHGLEVPLH